jgi:hypothetical protein
MKKKLQVGTKKNTKKMNTSPILASELEILRLFLQKYRFYARNMLMLFGAAGLFAWVAVGWYESWWAATTATMFSIYAPFRLLPMYRFVQNLQKDSDCGQVEVATETITGATRRRTLFGAEEYFVLTDNIRMLVAQEALLGQLELGEGAELRRTLSAKLLLSVNKLA